MKIKIKIKIYILDHCLSCKEALDFFEEKGVQLEIIDITYDQERFNEMVKKGGIATPFIVMGDQIFHTFDRKNWENYMEGTR